MRIITFTIALFLGVYTTSFFKSADSEVLPGSDNLHQHSVNNTLYSSNKVWFTAKNFDLNRNYTEAEAKALIGKKVRNLTPLNAKCPKDAGNCLNLNIGEIGEVVGILPSLSNTFLIEIQWNEDIKNNRQPSGIYVTRAGKEVSFKILD